MSITGVLHDIYEIESRREQICRISEYEQTGHSGFLADRRDGIPGLEQTGGLAFRVHSRRTGWHSGFGAARRDGIPGSWQTGGLAFHIRFTDPAAEIRISPALDFPILDFLISNFLILPAKSGQL